MKLFSTLFFVCLLFAAVYADDNVRFIEVNGSATLEERADQISWQFQIRIIDSSIALSKQQNDKSLSALTGILKSIGADDNDIEVFPVTQGKNYIYDGRKRVSAGYYTTVFVKFLQKDLSRYSGLISKLSQHDNIEVLNANYENSNYEQQHKTALKKALIAAKEKAGYLAQTLDLKIDSVLEIHELSGYENRAAKSNVLYESAGGGQQASGVVTVKRSIQVKFSLK